MDDVNVGNDISVVETENTDNSENITTDEPENNADNSDNNVQEPENQEDTKEPKSKFETLEAATKSYEELQKKLGEQSNELGELRKAAEKLKEYEEKKDAQELAEAKNNGFENLQDYQLSKQENEFLVNEYRKHLNECDFPDEMEKLLENYLKNPSDELLETIESEFSNKTIKSVARNQEIFKGQLQAKQQEALEEEVRGSARKYLEDIVPKYTEEFKNPAFAAMFGEAFKAYGLNLDAERFVGLMKNFADEVVKSNGFKTSIANENKNETDEIAGLTNRNNKYANGSSGSLINLSQAQLEKRLDDLI